MQPRALFPKLQLRYLICFLLTFAGFLADAQIFTWSNPNLPKDSLKKDSTIAARIERDVFTKDTADFVKSGGKIIIEEAAIAKTDRSKILGDLSAKGAIIRGITFGNNQGSSAQSSMDLQLSGKISKDISVLASISDHNMPIQADGYTQSLDEFDKIFIKLGIKKYTSLTGGHIDLDDNSAYFARYQRRTMGLLFETKLGSANSTDFNISAGIARSEFDRIRFQGIEGNLGPYRLTGRNGENFITVIPGSEQVYIDGILMQRGEKQDYTINYSTGEVTFTSYRPIYRQNFITISYNYTNRNYSRYLVTGGISRHTDRLKYGLSWFLENDNKNAPLSLNLSKEDEQILVAAGSSQDLMLAPSGTQEAYDVNKILYKKVTDAAGSHYEFSTDPAETLFSVPFTYFGIGKGDYRLKQTTNNGRVFEFAGYGLGDYAAVRKLPAPQKSQVVSTNAEYLLNKGKIGTDFSLSNYDPNLFSSIDNAQNIGYAGRIFGDKIFENNNWRATARTEYQHIDRRFHILDRINNVEFSRDFNLQQEFSGRTQDRFMLSVQNQWKNKSWLNYYGNFLSEKNFYRGIKNDLDFGFLTKKTVTKGGASYLDTKSDFEKTNFIKANLLSEFLGKKGLWGIGALMETNIRKYAQTDRYDALSYRWKEVFAQKKIGDSLRTKLFAKAYYRDNDSVRADILTNVNHIAGFMAESEIIKTERTHLRALAHYRKFLYQNNDLAGNNDFLIGNLDYSQKFFRNGMRIQAFYELGNGQEPQREFQYIKVTDGQGVYKWTDYNGDGAQQLDEFEIAEYADLARYIRIYTNTTAYVPTNKNKLQLSLFVNPALVINSQNLFVKRWNISASLFSQNSYLKGDRAVVLNTFEREERQILRNQNLLAGAQFNPTAYSGWNGGYHFTKTDNLVNANYSREETRRSSHSAMAGYQFSQDFNVNWETVFGRYQGLSEVFQQRNFLLNLFETKPKATYKLSSNLLAEIAGAYRTKTRLDGIESLKACEISGTLQWDKPKTSIRGSFSFIDNKFSGESFSIVGNQMLEGLKPGKNEVWNLFIQQALNSFINLNISYEGRNSGDRTIHIGSMQLRASF